MYLEYKPPIKDCRHEQMLRPRPGHEFKFWSMDNAVNTISDEPTLIDQISVKAIWMNQTFVEPIWMNQIIY